MVDILSSITLFNINHNDVNSKGTSPVINVTINSWNYALDFQCRVSRSYKVHLDSCLHNTVQPCH